MVRGLALAWWVWRRAKGRPGQASRAKGAAARGEVPTQWRLPSQVTALEPAPGREGWVVTLHARAGEAAFALARFRVRYGPCPLGLLCSRSRVRARERPTRLPTPDGIGGGGEDWRTASGLTPISPPEKP